MVDVFTKDEFDKVKAHSPLLTPPPDTTNKYADNAAAATLGQKLFFDKAFSGPIVTGDDGTNGGNGKVGERGKIACASCHQTANWMIDRRTKPNNTSLGTDWMIRNAATAINSSFYVVWAEKDGLRDTQWSDGLTDPEDGTSMNGSRLLVAHTIFKKYRTEYDAIFTPPLDAALDPMAADAARLPAEGKPGDSSFDGMAPADKVIVNRIYANFGKALQAYLRLLVSRNAPFDRYVAGNYSAISESAKRGLKLFIGKAACDSCHTGPAFTDSKFHNVGMVQMGTHTINTETGRFDAIPLVLGNEFSSDGMYSDDTKSGRLAGLTQSDTDKGRWRTTQLRHVAETAPYMHTGQMATLGDVIDFYNKGGDASGFIGTRDPLIKELHLTTAEVADLVEFLKTLTGDPPPAALQMDTSKP